MDVKTYVRTQWDRVAAWSAAAIGLLALLIGFIGVSGTAYLVEQVPYIVSGAIFGLFCLGVGATLWISADLRDEWRKLDDLERAVTELREQDAAMAASTAAAAALVAQLPEPVTTEIPRVSRARKSTKSVRAL